MDPVEGRAKFTRRRRIRITAAVGVVLGLVIAVGAYLFTSTSDLCAQEAHGSIPARGQDLRGEFTSAERIWPPLVGARCTTVLANDLRFTTTVINWPATTAALGGLALAGAAVLVWYRCRIVET